MDNINGIPLIWDREEDERLFGQLYPNGLSVSVLAGNPNTDPLASVRTTKIFEEISNERALQTPLGKNSIFYTELKGDFFDGYVPFIPILWKLGAPMPDKEENVGKGTKLPEIIIKVEKKVEQKIFDYAKYSEQAQEAKNYWEYQENNFAGQAILNKKIGYIDTEKIFFDKNGAGFNLYIPYADDSKVSINNPNIEYLKANAIIKLTQLDPDAFIIILSNLANSKRKQYVEKIFKWIVSEIESILKNKNAVEMLFDIPINLLRMFKKETVESIFTRILEQKSIPWYRETILINILKVLPEKEGFNATTFLNSLVKPKDDGSNYFQKLYDRMNDWGGENNFSQLIIELTKIWSFSVYTNPFYEIYKKYDAPAPIAYNQNYILGFRNDNFDFEFKENNALLIQEKVIRDGKNIGKKHLLHIFQPVEVANLEEKEAENLKLEEQIKLPAFYLKAFDDKSAWENFEKAIWLGVDVLTTATGIGNLAKLRHLAKTKNGYIALKTIFGIIEVATGTISIGLALIENSQNKEVINKVREYLFWLEICTLGADILSTKILSKKASEAKNALDSYRKTVNNEKVLDNIDEFSEHLDEVAELDLMAKPAEIGKFGGKKMTASQIRKYKGWLKQNGVETFLEEDLIRNKIGKITNKESLNKFKPFMSDGIQFDTLQDFYSYMKQEGGLGVFHAKTKQLFLTKEPTELMSFHEKMHVKHYLEIGEKYHTLPTWEKETYVFQEVWKQKHLYTKEELEFSLKYVNGHREKAGQKLLNYKR